MRGRIAFFVFFLLAGCGVAVLNAASDSDGGSVSAGTDASLDGDGGGGDDASQLSGDGASTDDDGGIADGSSSEAGEAGCMLLVVDNFTPGDSRWVKDKDAVFDAGAAVLVIPQEQHHGSIFIKVPAEVSPAHSFEATFTMLIRDAGVPPGDGIMLAWASDITAPHIGGTGGEIGFCPNSNSQDLGPNGAALAFHVSSPIGISPRESDGGKCIVPSAVAPFTFKSSQTASVSVNDTSIGASVEGLPYAFTISTAVPIRWIGFTAATGGAVATFSVDDVTIKVCP